MNKYILVGVDDTPESQLALHWAVEAAKGRGAAVRVVRAYLNELSRWPALGVEGYVPPPMPLDKYQARGRSRGAVRAGPARLRGRIRMACEQRSGPRDPHRGRGRRDGGGRDQVAEQDVGRHAGFGGDVGRGEGAVPGGRGAR